MKFTYLAFGIPVISEIELPALYKVDSFEENESPIYVRKGLVPENLEHPPTEIKPYSTFNETEFKYQVPDIGKYYVRDGQEVIIEPIGDNTNEFLLYFYCNCLAAALFQRNIIPFHVSGVFVGLNKVVLFAAHSRTGKSTLAIKLHERGYPFFTDDTATIYAKNGKVFARASYPMLRLWQETIDNQYVVQDKEKSLLYETSEIEKYSFSFQEGFQSGAVEVAAIVFIEKTDAKEEVIFSLSKAMVLKELAESAYRLQWMEKMNKMLTRHHLLMGIIQGTDFYKASRLNGVDTIQSFPELIENSILKLYA